LLISLCEIYFIYVKNITAFEAEFISHCKNRQADRENIGSSMLLAQTLLQLLKGSGDKGFEMLKPGQRCQDQEKPNFR